MRDFSRLNADAQRLVHQLYQRYKFLMFKITKGIVRNIDLAEDMVSEACIVMMVHIEMLRKLDEVRQRAYIIAICRSVSINYVVKQNRQSKHCFSVSDHSLFDLAVLDTRIVEEEVLWIEEISQLYEAISKMPERERLLIKMKYFDKMKDEQIAVKLKIKTDSVRFYLTKARRCLARILEEEYHDG